MAIFFKVPFGTGGDKTAIPITVQPDGSVSYTEGFGPNYEANPLTDPDALPVPRLQTNEFYYQISLAMQQYQTLSVPEFITSSDNGGAPYSYNKGVNVLYDDGINGPLVYQSQVNSNT